jgi:hypothetical protein
MEKYILVPYAKYQRLQTKRHCLSGSGNIEEPQKADEEIAIRKTDTHSKRNIVSDVLPKTVGKIRNLPKPPPGIRDKQRNGKRANAEKSNRTEPKQRAASIQWLT